jgi:hypothetical protein
MRRMLWMLPIVIALTAALPSLARAMHGPGDNVGPQQQPTAAIGHRSTDYVPIAAGVAGGIVLLAAGLLTVGLRRERRAEALFRSDAAGPA